MWRRSRQELCGPLRSRTAARGLPGSGRLETRRRRVWSKAAQSPKPRRDAAWAGASEAASPPSQPGSGLAPQSQPPLPQPRSLRLEMSVSPVTWPEGHLLSQQAPGPTWPRCSLELWSPGPQLWYPGWKSRGHRSQRAWPGLASWLPPEGALGTSGERAARSLCGALLQGRRSGDKSNNHGGSGLEAFEARERWARGHRQAGELEEGRACGPWVPGKAGRSSVGAVEAEAGSAARCSLPRPRPARTP